MLDAIVFSVLSLIAGTAVGFFSWGWGIVVSISIIGFGIISSIENKK